MTEASPPFLSRTSASGSFPSIAAQCSGVSPLLLSSASGQASLRRHQHTRRSTKARDGPSHKRAGAYSTIGVAAFADEVPESLNASAGSYKVEQSVTTGAN